MIFRIFHRPALLGLLGSLVVVTLYHPVVEAWMPQKQQPQQQQQHRITSRITSSLPSSSLRTIKSTLFQTQDTQEDEAFSRESLEGGDVNGGGSSRIIPAAMTGKSQLAAAFTALDESDQYDAVLTGLCAKILDAKKNDADHGNDENSGSTRLEDPAALLTEMNDRKIPASPRSLMALIDVS